MQKRSLNWPQDLDGETRVVELYVVNDNSQVSWLMLFNCQAACRRIQSMQHSKEMFIDKLTLLFWYWTTQAVVCLISVN